MKTSLSLRAWLGSTTLCLLALAAGQASAASLSVSGYTLGESVSVISGAHTGTVNTAQLDIGIPGDTGFGYCVDLAQSIGVGTTSGWDLRNPALSDSVIRAAWLVDTFQPQLDSLVHPAGDAFSFAVTRQTAIAALQVSIWEVMSETPGNYDLYSGAFSLAKGGASAGVMNLSRQFLGALSGADLSSFQTGAIWAVSPTQQDQLFFGHTNPIPEPGTALLYAFGAAIVAFSLRRQIV
jgi:hypothetical protein